MQSRWLRVTTLPPPLPSPPSSHLRDSAMRDAIHGRKYENPPPIMREPRAFGGPSTLFLFAHSDICLSYVFALWVAALFRLKRVAFVRLCFSPPSFFFHPITRRICLDFRRERWALIRRVGLPSGRRDLARWCKTRVGGVLPPMNRAVLLFRSQCATFHSFAPPLIAERNCIRERLDKSRLFFFFSSPFGILTVTSSFLNGFASYCRLENFYQIYYVSFIRFTSNFISGKCDELNWSSFSAWPVLLTYIFRVRSSNHYHNLTMLQARFYIF